MNELIVYIKNKLNCRKFAKFLRLIDSLSHEEAVEYRDVMTSYIEMEEKQREEC